MSDVKQHHRDSCPNYEPVLDLSLDGIQESKSSALSVDVYTVSFKNCKTVYPIRIIRPINKYKFNEQIQLKTVVADINQNHCKIKNAIMDNPKRSMARCALCSGASYACEYCESRAEYVRILDFDKKLKGQIAWPFSTFNGPKRTKEKIVDITQKIESKEITTKEEKKGFWGTSTFLNQDDFDFIENLPVEYMHSGCIGVVKRMVVLTFNVGEVRKRKTKRKLSDVSEFNKLISLIQSPHEWNRRCRHLDLGVMKAQEFRNLIICFFPIVVKCIPNSFKKEQKTWLQLAYIVRACTISNKEFNEISKKKIEQVAESFYKNFESVYGKHNCSYSVHVFPSHILQIRGDEPLTSKSAFKFENFYAELRNLFQPGTQSTSKQILQNCYMKRQLEFHCCEKKFVLMLKKMEKKTILMCTI